MQQEEYSNDFGLNRRRLERLKEYDSKQKDESQCSNYKPSKLLEKVNNSRELKTMMNQLDALNQLNKFV